MNEEKKKLVILSDMDLWFGNTPGVIRMNNYAKALSSKNEIYFISTKTFNDSIFLEVENNIFVQEQKISKITSKTNLLNKLITNLNFAKSIKIFNNKLHADSFLIYPSTNTSFELFLLLFLKILSKNKVYYELNEIRKYSLQKNKIIKFKKILIYLIDVLRYSLIPLTWKFYDGLICNNKNIANYANKYNNRIVIIPILSDIQLNNYEKTHSRNEFVIFFSGSISIRKENLKEFIYGLILFDEVFKNWKFEFCGPVEGNDLKILYEIIHEHKLDNKISYLGNIPHDKVILKQNSSDLLVLPRANTRQSYYGFSTKLAEYAMSGTPILITKTGVITDFFIDGFNCFLVDGYSRYDFLNSLKKIYLTTENQRKQIASNAINLAKNYFDYHKYSEKIDNFLFR